LYLHIPFCEIKCAYCDFYSLVGSQESQRERYVGALCAEIQARGTGEPADTIFFGGGTPSVLSPQQICRILQALRGSFQVDPAAEITMEANPETVTGATLQGFREAGINRLSFGVQSLQDDLLRTLGRIHSAERACWAITEASAAGFDNVNADLIFGLPGQTAEIWRRDLGTVLALPITHLSCYELIIEEGTAFGFRPPKLPDEEVVIAQWDIVMEETLHAGYAHYEVSNYAAPGWECRHNLKYWRDEEFFGFGASAWGSRGDTRCANSRSLRRYLERQAGGFPPAEIDSAPRPVKMAETLILNLRLRQGCHEGAFKARYGEEIWPKFADALSPHLAAGRLERSGGWLKLTTPGLLVANEVWADILAAA